eukprot:5393954-Pleurochrysis_carterae.AAC.1
MTIIDKLKDRFTQADRDEWNKFFDDYPKKVDDIPTERMQDFLAGHFLPRCSVNMPDAAGLASAQ